MARRGLNIFCCFSLLNYSHWYHSNEQRCRLGSSPHRIRVQVYTHSKLGSFLFRSDLKKRKIEKKIIKWRQTEQKKNVFLIRIHTIFFVSILWEQENKESKKKIQIQPMASYHSSLELWYIPALSTHPKNIFSTLCPSVKGGLISETFSLLFKSSKMGAKSLP